VVAEDGALSTAWSVPGSPTALLASAALALRGHLAAHPDRLGVCADRQCADVYVDASPAGHRRFCSLTCQNRTRVAAFRERRRSTR
jgi:predicted RNA-binding Zn ribbon-like protein